MRSTMPFPGPGPARAGADGPLSRRRVLRGGGAVAAAAALALATGCEVRLGSGAPDSLPTPSAAEATRDALARHSSLIASTADVVAGSDSQGADVAERLAASARTQLDALGGVWQPWESPPPSGYPTASPVPTASSTATAGELVTMLTEGATRASTAASQASETTAAHLYASLAVAWLLGAISLDDGAVETPGRSASASAPVPGPVLQAYDGARYAFEEVAARATDDQRTRATEDAAYAGGVVSASLALGGQDTRLSAYAPPAQAADDASLDVTWARQAWRSVMEAEVAGVEAEGGEATAGAINAAADAARRAQAWGATTDEPLPGYVSA